MVDEAGALTDVGVLGPLRLRIGGSWTGVGAPRQRMVLGVLLVHAGEVVTADRLLHEAWDGNPPNAGVQALRYHLSRLRDQLVPGRGRGVEGPIHTIGSGYRLAPGYGTDADRFEGLAARGSRAGASEQWASAIDSFDEALGLWRGDAWADFRDEDFAQPEIRRLEERRLQCLEERMDARLAAGASRGLVAELHELTARYPSRERFWAQTMVALHRAGRDGEAARVYEAARQAMRTELGVEPGALMQRLHQRVADQDLRGDDVPADVLSGAAAPASVSDGSRRKVAEVAAAPAVTSRPAPGDAGPSWTRGALLEREEELAVLRHELSAAEHVSGRVVLVRGEAGIGKSVLVRRFLADVAEDAATSLGTCDDLDAPQPWAPLWDVARNRPELAAALHDGDRRRVMEATLQVLTPPSGPAILVVEDTQWADEATLDVIMYVGRRIDRTRAILLVTFRDRAVDDDHPLRRILGTLPAGTVTRIRPDPLSEEAVRTMVGGSSRDPEVLRAVTGGNPLFVSEMLATDGDTLPRSIRDAVLARLSRLPPRSRQLVELVSVVPGRTGWTTVEDVLGSEPLGTRQAVRRGLLDVDDDGVMFRHELQRRAVEAALTPPQRRRLHQQVLAALDPDTDPARLAHHARHADDTEALLTHARRAGERALAAHSHREAADHFRSIDALVDELPAHEAADILESWASATRHIDPRAAVPIVVRAVTLRRGAGDPVPLARTLAFGAFVLQLGQRGDEGAAWATEAVAILERDGPSPDLAYALTERARALGFVNDPAAADVADSAIAVAEEVGDERTAVSSTILAGVERSAAADPDGRAMLARARSRARRGGHHFEEADACATLALVALRLRGDLETAIGDLEQARALAAEHEFLELLAFVDGITAIVLMWSGDWDRAEDAAAAVLATVAPADAQVLARCVVGLLATRRGRDGADEHVRLAWAQASRFGTTYLLDAAGAVVAEYVWVTGDQHAWVPGRDELSRYDNGIVRGFDHERLLFWGALSDPSTGTPDGIDRGYAAILDGDVGEAAAIWGERDHGYEQAIALLHGSVDDGIRAVRMLEDLGANSTAARGREMLRERGVAVPRGRSRAAREHAAGLTRRQAEVLDLLAVGCSNPEIADELFISRRTVENHVTEVLRKLDAGSRNEAVATARTRGLLAGG